MQSNVQWSQDQIERVVRRAVVRKRAMFGRFVEFDDEDLLHEAMLAARMAHDDYDPGHGAYSTWIYRAASLRLIDLWRQRARHAAHEPCLAIGPADTAPDPAEVLAGQPPQSLADWLGGIYRRARHTFPRRRRRCGHEWYNIPQIVAVLMLMKRDGLSIDAARELFRAHPDLRQAVHFRHLPPLSWFRRTAALGAPFLARRFRRTWNPGEAT